MKIINENGFIDYTIEESEITIDRIIVNEKRQGTGKLLISELKKIAKSNNLPIGLYAEPLNDSIDESDLNEFYLANGFKLDVDDIDNKLFIWKN